MHTHMHTPTHAWAERTWAGSWVQLFLQLSQSALHAAGSRWPRGCGQQSIQETNQRNVFPRKLAHTKSPPGQPLPDSHMPSVPWGPTLCQTPPLGMQGPDCCFIPGSSSGPPLHDFLIHHEGKKVCLF